MEDILDVYARPHDPRRPLVCLDESFKQLIAETRIPIAATAGRIEKYDYEYIRQGVKHLFMVYAPLEGKRHVRVTDNHKKREWAYMVKHIVDVQFPTAEKIVLVEDNLDTHNPAVLYEVFAPEEAKRLIDKIEWHYTPKHASWLDQAEIEIHAVEEQCLNRRIPDFHTMQSEVAACVKKRNNNKCGINWQFTREKAKQKFKITLHNAL